MEKTNYKSIIKTLMTTNSETLMTTNMKRSATKFLWCLVFILVSFSVCTTVQAASLYFSPSSGSYNIGSTITASVYVSSPGQAMNAASGVILFPKDKLEAVSLSKTGSIINLWVQDPFFSNTDGSINFEGILLNPGFTGAAGKIISIVFKVKAAGTSALSFSSGSVLANDGNGTEILSNKKTASFSLNTNTTPSQAPPATLPPAEATGLPGAPAISSLTHPDPEKWYSNSNPKFSWDISPDISAVKLLYDKNPDSTPQILYNPPIFEKNLTDVKDGSYYFHAQFLNAIGWGPASSLKFQIDTEKPTKFDISQLQQTSLTDPKVKFSFDAEDKTSGIDHYEVYIDNQETEIWTDDGSHIYQTNAVSPGKHVLIARAVDKAGNYLANFAEFLVDKVEPPTITYYPKDLQNGEIFAVKGTTLHSNTDVIVYLQEKKGDISSWSAISDENGDFALTIDEKLKNGDYKLWAAAKDASGVLSSPTPKLSVFIGFPVLFRLGQWTITMVDMIIFLSALIFILMLFLFYIYMRYKFRKFRKKGPKGYTKKISSKRIYKEVKDLTEK